MHQLLHLVQPVDLEVAEEAEGLHDDLEAAGTYSIMSYYSEVHK